MSISCLVTTRKIDWTWVGNLLLPLSSTIDGRGGFSGEESKSMAPPTCEEVSVRKMSGFILTFFKGGASEDVDVSVEGLD